MIPFIIHCLWLLDLLFWLWGDSRLRRAIGPGALRVVLRIALAAFMLNEIFLYVAWLFDFKIVMLKDTIVPKHLISSLFVWHIMVVLPTLLIIAAANMGSLALAFARRRRTAPQILPAVDASPACVKTARGATLARDWPVHAAQRVYTRRGMLRALAVAAPPLVTAAAVQAGFETREDFRLNAMEVRLPDLPAALDGLVIAHVSDIHLGWYSTQAKTDAMIKAVNGMNADIIAMTGDLIDFDINDVYPAIDILKSFKSRLGMVTCIGNHDMKQNADHFRHMMEVSGIDLLFNERSRFSRNGAKLEFLGVEWNRSEHLRDNSLKALAARRDTSAYPICLVHHPHGFDAAAACNIPLTLSGHTHGGQIMLTRSIGAGAIPYRYVSGLYTKPGAQLIVNNGVGDWFPLRINAPAEIIQLTLRRAPASA